MDEAEPGVAKLMCHEFDVKFPNGVTNCDFENGHRSKDLFRSCLGVEIDNESGSVRLLLSQPNKEKNEGPLFCKNDIKSIMQNCTLRGKLEFCDPCHSLTYCKLSPDFMQESNFLSTLLQGHNLCQEFVKLALGDVRTVHDHDYGDDEEPETLFTQVHCGTATGYLTEPRLGVLRYQFDDHFELLISLETSTGEALLTVSTNQWSEKLVGEKLPESICRLQELAKLIAVVMILFGLRSDNESMKHALELRLSEGPTDFDAMRPVYAEIIQNREVRIIKFLEEYRIGWNPPYSESAVNKEWQEVLRRIGMEYKEHLLPPGVKSDCISQIRNNLRLADKTRYDRCAKTIGETLHVPVSKLRPQMPSYLLQNSSTLANLVELCCIAWWEHEAEKTRRIIAELEEIGIKFNPPQIPDLFLPYGGIVLGPNVAFTTDQDPNGGDKKFRSIPIISLLQTENEEDEGLLTEEENDDLMPYFYKELQITRMKKKLEPRMTEADQNILAREDPNRKKLRRKGKSSRLKKIGVFLLDIMDLV